MEVLSTVVAVVGPQRGKVSIHSHQLTCSLHLVWTLSCRGTRHGRKLIQEVATVNYRAEKGWHSYHCRVGGAQKIQPPGIKMPTISNALLHSFLGGEKISIFHLQKFLWEWFSYIGVNTCFLVSGTIGNDKVVWTPLRRYGLVGKSVSLGVCFADSNVLARPSRSLSAYYLWIRISYSYLWL